MRKRLLSEGPNGKSYFIDHGDGRYGVAREQDVEPLLDYNKALINSGHDGYSKERERAHVAHIPMSIALKWYTEEGWWCFATHDPDVVKKLKQKLNDPEYHHLRTSKLVL